MPKVLNDQGKTSLTLSTQCTLSILSTSIFILIYLKYLLLLLRGK